MRRGAHNRNTRILLTAALAAACGEPPLGDIRAAEAFAVRDAEVWSGSSLTLTSAGFAAALPAAITLSGTPLAFSRLDDTTLLASLPDRPGAHTVRVVAPTVQPTGVVVYLRGFAERMEGPAISGRLEPGLDPRHVFGNGPATLRRWNVATNKTVDYDTVHAVGCTRGVGPGPGAGQLVLRPECGGTDWTVWRTEPLAALPDTAAGATEHFVAVLAPGRWVILRDEEFVSVACDDGGASCTAQSIAGSGGWDVVRSPGGDRAALLTRRSGVSALPGAPVIDVSLGAVGYRVGAVRAAQAAAFSRGGDTLYLAGDSGSATRLVAVRAADGGILGARDLLFEPCALAVDPERPWLYVAGAGLLQVFDQATLTPITTLHVTGDAAFGSHFCRILPNPVGHRVSVAETWFGEPSVAVVAQLYHFDTP